MKTNKLFGFNSKLYFLTVMAGCLSLTLMVGSITIYSESPMQNVMEWKIQDKEYKTTPWSNEGEKESSSDNLNNAATASLTTETQTASIVGAWRSYSNISGYSCVSESVVQANGQYSAITSCNNNVYQVYLKGYWRYLQNGVIRIQYTYCSYQRGDGGRAIPDGDTIYFSFINRNQIRLGNGIIANRIG